MLRCIRQSSSEKVHMPISFDNLEPLQPDDNHSLRQTNCRQFKRTYAEKLDFLNLEGKKLGSASSKVRPANVNLYLKELDVKKTVKLRQEKAPINFEKFDDVADFKRQYCASLRNDAQKKRSQALSSNRCSTRKLIFTHIA